MSKGLRHGYQDLFLYDTFVVSVQENKPKDEFEESESKTSNHTNDIYLYIGKITQFIFGSSIKFTTLTFGWHNTIAGRKA